MLFILKYSDMGDDNTKIVCKKLIDARDAYAQSEKAISKLSITLLQK